MQEFKHHYIGEHVVIQEDKKKKSGDVVYVHPTERWYSVIRPGGFRESFFAEVINREA